jgi:hypothetical protein
MLLLRMGEYPRQSRSINTYAAKERNRIRAVGGDSDEKILMPKSMKAFRDYKRNGSSKKL